MNKKDSTTWRFVLTRDLIGDQEDWTIRELYIGTDGSLSWTVAAIPAAGDTADGVREDLERMLAATDLPYLDLSLNPPALVERKGS